MAEENSTIAGVKAGDKIFILTSLSNIESAILNNGDKKDDDDNDDVPPLEDDDNFVPVSDEILDQRGAIVVIQKLLALLEKKKLTVKRWGFPQFFAPYLTKRIFDLLADSQQVDITSKEHGFILESDSYHNYLIQLKTTEMRVNTTVNFNTNFDAFRVTFGHELEVPFFRVFLGKLFEEKNKH